MEKYGIEKEKEVDEKENKDPTESVKLAQEELCLHPRDKVKIDGDVKFCTVCKKYLGTKK